MNIAEFKASLDSDEPPAVSVPLQALWYESKGEWDRAHNLLQDDHSAASAWAHAYLHRKQGDNSNGAHWYVQAGKPAATGSFDDEWKIIAESLLKE